MSDHVWRVGDLCTCTYNEMAGGIIYRVIDVDGPEQHEDKKPWNVLIATQLKITPIFGIFNPDFKRKRVRKIGTGWCQPVDLVSMGVEYMKLGQFIAGEAERRGAELSPKPAA